MRTHKLELLALLSDREQHALTTGLLAMPRGGAAAAAAQPADEIECDKCAAIPAEGNYALAPRRRSSIERTSKDLSTRRCCPRPSGRCFLVQARCSCCRGARWWCEAIDSSGSRCWNCPPELGGLPADGVPGGVVLTPDMACDSLRNARGTANTAHQRQYCKFAAYSHAMPVAVGDKGKAGPFPQTSE